MDDIKSYHKLSQFWHFISYTDQSTTKADSYKTTIDNILKDDFNINHRFTIRSESRKDIKDILKDCTALHSAYVCDTVAVASLLEHGADFTMKNGKGDTVLHSSVQSINMKITDYRFPSINSILSAHVKYQNVSNPCNENGISHLHGACIANHVDSLKLFLDNGASIEQTVNSASWDYPGYTPLHFVAQFASFEAAQLLVSHGADVNFKDAIGRTPLDQCLNCRVELLSNLTEITYSCRSKQSFQKQLCKNEKVIKLLLDSQCVSAYGLTNLHVASTLNDLSIAEKILNQGVNINHAVPVESPTFSGYTAAHFAALNNIDALKILMIHGAKLDIEDVDGITALDICIKNYSAQDFQDILVFAKNCKSIRLGGDKNTLLDFLQSTKNLDQFKALLQNVAEDVIVPSDSSFWQGYTMLQLAVTLSKRLEKLDANYQVVYEKSLMEECLKLGQSVNVQNSRGETAIHLAFKLEKISILKLLLERLNSQEEVANLVDEDNLSYLHIACTIKDEILVEKLLRTSEANIIYKGKKDLHWCRIVAGSTPLHVAASSGTVAIAEMLLRHGADVHATDTNGVTPIHRLIRNDIGEKHDQQVADAIFRALLDYPKDCVVDSIGLSYLHVACFFGNVQAVHKLLELGSDVNAVIGGVKSLPKDGLAVRMLYSKYSSYTPLYMTQGNPVAEVIDLLILHGADVFAKTTNVYYEFVNIKLPLDNKDIIRPFMLTLWNREEIQKKMEVKMGLTRLHIACYLKNEEFVRSALNNGVGDINARIHEDSEIFAGYTPLHTLLKISRDARGCLSFNRTGDFIVEIFALESIVELLLAHGADVTIMAVKKNTPIHLFCKNQHRFPVVQRSRVRDLLINAHRDFSVDPANEKEMSHFHLACHLHKIEIVEKFLRHGTVKVSQPTDFFAKNNPGSTPLHLALKLTNEFNPDWPRVMQTVDLLLRYGAEVTAKDAFGDTPLHQPAAIKCPELNIFNKLVNHGADVNVENVKGETPLDILVFSGYDNPNVLFGIFKKYNYRLNSWNRLTGEGRFGKMLSSPWNNITESPKFKELLQSSDVKAVDEMGRTVIHNSVDVERGTFANDLIVFSAIKKFVQLGIDPEHQDVYGQTALHYATELVYSPGVQVLLKCGADINIVDNDGMSALSHVVRHIKQNNFDDYYESLEKIAIILHIHVQKLLRLRIEVSESNKNFSNFIRQIIGSENFCVPEFLVENINLKEEFFNEIERTKTVDVGVNSFVLFDFLNETGAITLYPFLSPSERTVINNCFENLKEEEYDELNDILKLQYCKMKTKLELIEPAFTALRILLGFSFPGLCEEIARFLTNTDLKNLIALTNLDLTKEE